MTASAGWDALDGVEPDVPPTVTVVVAHYEQPDDLARTLRALRRQTHPADRLEIVVVDDGSRTAPEVPAGVTLLRQEDRGFRLAAARNLGASAATGDVLCFLDADCAPEPAFVSTMARLPSLRPDVVTVGRRRHADLTGTPVDLPLEDLPADRVLDEPAWLRDAYRRSRNLLDADARSYRHVIGAVIGCSRAFFAETGGFDESFTAYGGEDWEWAWRCWQAGAEFAHVPAAVAWHNGPDAGARARDRTATNDETRRLQARIPVHGSRPHALLGGPADVLAVVRPGWSAGAVIIAVDGLLRRLPTARVAVPGRVPPELQADPRVRDGAETEPYRLEVLAPLRVLPAADLQGLVDRVGTGTTGAVEVADAEGVLLRISSTRVDARRRRWGAAVLQDLRVPAAGLVRRLSEAEPSLAAHYGDWG